MINQKTFASRLNELDVPTPSDVVALIYEADEQIVALHAEALAIKSENIRLMSENTDIRRMFSDLLHGMRDLIERMGANR